MKSDCPIPYYMLHGRLLEQHRAKRTLRKMLRNHSDDAVTTAIKEITKPATGFVKRVVSGIANLFRRSGQARRS